MRSALGSILVVGIVGAGSACRPAAPVAPVAHGAALPAMTFFGSDDPDYPKVAAALNERVRAKFPKSATMAHAPVSLEEAQIAVGCVEASTKCWTAVAKSVSAPALLIAEVSASKPKGVHVGVRIFDSRSGSILRAAERTMTTAELAIGAVPLIVDELLSASRK